MALLSREATCHLENDLSHFVDAQVREASADQGTSAEPGTTCEASTSDKPTLPLTADITSGSKTPIAKGFLMAQRRTIPVDRLFGEHHDLSDGKVQTELHNMLPKTDFVWAALDCSVKTRCRDQFYDACSLQGARKKKQRIRKDIEEIRCWPNMRCKHTPHLQEWDPVIGKNGMVYIIQAMRRQNTLP